MIECNLLRLSRLLRHTIIKNGVSFLRIQIKLVELTNTS
jgi:hypothetical protein